MNKPGSRPLPVWAFLAMALIGVISLMGLLATSIVSQRQTASRLGENADSLSQMASALESLGQGETNRRLDQALAEQAATNSSLKTLQGELVGWVELRFHRGETHLQSL